MHRRAFVKKAALVATTCVTGLSGFRGTCNGTSTGTSLEEVPGWKFRPAPATGPLRVHPANPRYFTDGSGQAIFLTGSHTWANFQDIGVAPLPKFEWSAY